MAALAGRKSILQLQIKQQQPQANIRGLTC